MAAFFHGIVKAVPSGDVVVVVGSYTGHGAPAEKTIKLSSISAPQLGWKDEREDEPYAWACREALRAKVIGKPVTFSIDGSAPSGNREYGDVYMGQESVARWLVANGWAKTRGTRNGDPNSEELKALEEAAEEAGYGMHSKDAKARSAAVRKVSSAKFDAQEFVESVKGTQVPVIVEQVRDGSTLRCTLLPSLQTVSVFVAGIRCPGFNRPPKDAPQGTSDVPQPFANEARFFTEIRLLHREVNMTFELADDNGNLYATVNHTQGNIAEYILREGLGRLVEWSAAHTAYFDNLRAAERVAQEKRLRVWNTYTPREKSVSANDREFEAIVTEVVSGDTIKVKTAAGERRIYLSSLMAPRVRRDEKSEPYAWEAKDFVRRRTVGQKVRIELDYMRSGDEKFPEPRAYATVIVGGKNLAIALLNQGFATVVRHRSDDERSFHYDELMKAQADAMARAVGLHNTKKAAPIHRMHDISRDDGTAATMLSRLQSAGRITATVEFVVNGGRVKVHLPRDDVVAPLILEGVRCPRYDSQGTGASEDFGAEAFAFTRAFCFQRDVEIEIAAVDKRGSFIGNLSVDGRDLGLALLEEGLAYPGDYLDRTTYGAQYTAAADRARAAKRNYWSKYVPPVKPVRDDTLDVEDAVVKEKTDEVYDVVVTEVIDPSHFYLQVLGEGTAALEALMGEFTAYHSETKNIMSAATNAEMKLKKGTMVSARFTQDDNWYRANVRAVEGGNVSVFFVDYGNSETVSKDRIRPLPEQFSKLPHQAREVYLSCTLPPPANFSDVLEDGMAWMRENILGQRMVGIVDFRMEEEWHISLVDPTSKDDVSVRLVGEGVLRINEKRRGGRFAKVMGKLRPEQDAAIANNRGIWQWGEVDFDEVDERKKDVGKARKKEELKELAGKSVPSA